VLPTKKPRGNKKNESALTAQLAFIRMTFIGKCFSLKSFFG